MATSKAPRALDRYSLLEHLGTGGTADVWRARDDINGRIVVLKQMRTDAGHVRIDRARFLAEASLIQRMPAGTVVPVVDAHDGPDGAAIVSAAVPGRTLHARLAEGPIAPREAAWIASRIAAALAEAHALGLVHRDVKPGNVLLADDGTVRLLDFGIARFTDASGAAPMTAELVVGTMPYLSPERLRGEPATASSDLYALGVVLQLMLGGGVPTSGGTPAGAEASRNDVPAGLAAIARGMVAVEPLARLGDARLAQALLSGWLATGDTPGWVLPTSSHVDPRSSGTDGGDVGTPLRPRQVRRAALATVGVGTLLSLGVATASLFLGTSGATPDAAGDAPALVADGGAGRSDGRGTQRVTVGGDEPPPPMAVPERRTGPGQRPAMTVVRADRPPDDGRGRDGDRDPDGDSRPGGDDRDEGEEHHRSGEGPGGHDERGRDGDGDDDGTVNGDGGRGRG